jgi:hypothetical protein
VLARTASAHHYPDDPQRTDAKLLLISENARVLKDADQHERI